MLSIYDVKKILTKGGYTVDPDNKVFFDETGEEIGSLEFVADVLRKKTHCSFESVYYYHGTLDDCLRCTECGTVIFSGEDERYDPNLKCPVCSDYEPQVPYWTKEDIESDEAKQAHMQMLEDMTAWEIERCKRRERRGLEDWELWKKEVRTKHKMFSLELKVDNITRGLRGLHFNMTSYDKDPYDEDMGFYTQKNKFTIPLSYSYFRIKYIFPYTSKCPTEFRKYTFWQNKPSVV